MDPKVEAESLVLVQDVWELEESENALLEYP